MYHDHQAAVIVEFVNQQLSQQAQQIINNTHPDIDITNVIDMRLILNHSRSLSTHIPRYYASSTQSTHSMNTLEPHETSSDYSQFTYHLRHVLLMLKHEDIIHNLSYYDHIEQIHEIDNLPSIQREILITFDEQAKISLLDHIWAINVRGHNISLTKAHLTDSQLKYHNLHVTSFKSFSYKTTESQALRVFRPYENMSYQLHQNIAYIAFKTNDQMLSVCNL